MSKQRGGESPICEYDVDVALAAAISESPEFLRWLLNEVGKQAGSPCWTASPAAATDLLSHVHQPGEAAGETDLLVPLLYAGRRRQVRRRLLIEDKLCSPFTPDQPQRYKHRAELAVSAGDCADCATVLVAAASYMETPGAELFDVRITFEQVADHLRRAVAAGKDAAKAKEWLVVFERAIEAVRHGYVLVVDEVNTDFWRAYRSFMAEHAPPLHCKASEERGRWALDVYFEQAVRGWNIKHSLHNEKVMIELLGWGEFLPDVRAAIGSLLTPEMHLGFAPKCREPGSTIHIWIDVPKVDTRVRFEQQVVEVRAGLDAAVRVQAWCLKHSAVLSALTAQIAARRKAR